MKRKGFTLIELLAVIVILAIILAIAVPSISNMISTSTKSAFESDAKMVLKSINYKKLDEQQFDATDVNEETIVTLLGLSNNNYESLGIILVEEEPVITIVGKNKWNGLVVCGTFDNMKVVSSTSDCSSDVVRPVITLLGTNPVSINQGSTYTDAGATATDNKDGNVTSKITVTSNVNPSVPGTYTVTYSVTDIAGNKGTAIRTVTVIDTVAPTVTFVTNGNATYAKTRSTVVNITDSSTISTLKYVWNTSTIVLTETSFTSATIFTNGGTIASPAGVSGSYYLWILSKDSLGNTAITRSNAFNLDNTAPVITITGTNPVTVNKGSSYTDAGSTATDNIDASVTVTSNGTVNPNIVGTYTITYSATDLSGNIALSKTRTINVVDVSAPVITILGSNPITLYVGETYIDAGSTATDDVDGNVTSKITTTSNVSTTTVGTYTVTYTVKDNANNTATKTRTVNVLTNVFTYSYAGNYQTFIAPKTGNYKIELWGAQGGDYLTIPGGRGGYTRGTISLNAGSNLYLYVAGAPGTDDTGGWNGGGTISPGQSAYGRAGGGATDARVVVGTWDAEASLRSRIMVAAGGGGANYRNYPDQSCGYGQGAGGSGGGLIGDNGISTNHTNASNCTYGWTIGTGATQTSGGQYIAYDAAGAITSSTVSGSFGGSLSSPFGQSGGGSGYYSGGAGAHGGGAGGSSFISGYTGCNAVNSSGTHTGQSNHYSGYVFTDMQMIAGNTTMPNPLGGTETGHSSNGYAKITYIP
jgi:prepilin-type N-terminal cleavage/methylation domain-containing protein